jgi:hypothetical protein
LTFRIAVLAFTLVGLASACGSSSGGGREVEIIATDSGCSPALVTATTKEKLTFKVVNQAKGDRELEGIEGTKLAEVLIPSGRTRSINYTTPSGAGTQKLKCYIPGGPTTIIEVRVS